MPPVILTCAVSGSTMAPDNHPYYPRNPEAIADAAIDAARAGATAVHIHARAPDGRHTREPEHFREIVERIADSDVDPIINLTCGGGARFYTDADNPGQAKDGSDVATVEGRIAHIRALTPEISSLDISTFSRQSQAGDYIFFNPTDILREMAATFKSLGVKTELEAYQPGDVLFGNKLIEEGLLDDPPLYQFVLGVRWTTPASVEAMQYMKSLVPEGALWAAFGVGRMQMPMVAAAALLGGHARVGLEDNWYLERGVYGSNADLVSKASTIIQGIGEKVATPDEGREMLGIAR